MNDKRYQITRPDGTVVRVTVPEDPEPELAEIIRDQFSPAAVAAIVAGLRPVHTNDQNVDRQVHYLAEKLTGLLGGDDQQARLAKELGL
jgi:hypothetical protein